MAELKWRDRRPSFSEYVPWLMAKHGVSISEVQSNHYQAVVDRISAAVRTSEFWGKLEANLSNINDAYESEKKERLLDTQMPDVKSKSWESFLNKTFRKNVLNNEFYPEAPKDGWLLPPDWTSGINDISRTTFVVRYLDGVEYLSDKIASICSELGLKVDRDYEAKIEGYYAVHMYIYYDVSVPTATFNTETIRVRFELQITTQVKEFVKGILHRIYDVDRIQGATSSKNWAWDYESDEFIAHNLGHIVHYVEGMIVQVRDRQRSRK